MGKLMLNVNRSGWVKPVLFSELQRAKLKRWISDVAIDDIQIVAATSNLFSIFDRDSPTVGEERSVLQQIQKLSEELLGLLNDAPPLSRATIQLVAHENLGGIAELDRLNLQLSQLTNGLTSELSRLPQQSHRTAPHVYMISKIFEVVQPFGIAISTAKGSRFFSVVAVVFEACNLHVDPRGSIRAFNKSLGHKS